MSNLGRIKHQWPECIKADFLDLFVGAHLGSGIARDVFVYEVDSSKVLKIEYASQSFQNAREWQIWHDLKDAPAFAKWLAPCHWISPCGMVLIQSRTMPANDKQRPARMPRFLTDTKRSNYGMLKDRFVCHDYGTAIVDYSGRERGVDWWD